MPNESGEWIMYGADEKDPHCLHTVDELKKYIEEVGFLPLFKNEIPGFSVEERTVADYWWTGHARDPWYWREIIAAERKIAYGKFFDNKAGFISREWMPHFANYRRNGYDFDALWEDGKANRRQKLIMDFFLEKEGAEYLSCDLKKAAGFGKGGEKNFDGILTGLQMQTYLCMCGFRQRRNKQGEAYGWPVAAYCTPETLFGRKQVTSAYRERPEDSRKKIVGYLQEIYPAAEKRQMEKVIK